VHLTRTTIFAPSVRLPAPKVTTQSAFAARASFTTSTIWDQGVWGRIPFLIPTTSKFFSFNAATSFSRRSVSRDRVPEQMIYTLEALKVSVTCLTQASVYGRPYEIFGDTREVTSAVYETLEDGGSSKAARKVSTEAIVQSGSFECSRTILKFE